MAPEGPLPDRQIEGSADNTPASPLSDKRNRAFLVGFAALVVIVLIFSSLGDEETASTPSTSPALSPTTSAEADPGHQIPPLDGCTLISSDDVIEALGLENDVSLISFSGGEACTWQPAVDGEPIEGVMAHLEPGSPADFETGATENGVTGTPVADLGDVASWFGGSDVGTLVAARVLEPTVLFMRLSISRPDVDNDTRLALAGTLLAQALETVEFGPPEPIEVNLCDLISDEEAEGLLAPHREGRPAARDPIFIIDNFPDVVDLSQPGDFECTKLILTEIYVRAQTAATTDFGAGASMEGITGEPLTGIGDRATWFEDVPSSGSFAAPHVTDVISVEYGELSFRVAIALPDLSPEEQFETTRDLARQALGRLPRGPDDLIVVDPDQPDLSALGFVDNLLAREHSREWTFEEGLIATLRLFAGEVEAGEVLRKAELADFSGTGIISLAQEYMETGTDVAASGEIGRLLELLIPVFETGFPPDASGSLTVALDGLFADLLAQEEEPPAGDEENQGYSPPPDEEGPLGYEPPGVFGPGECADFEPTIGGWDTSGFEIGETGPWGGAVLFPSEGLEGGWSRETHLLWALQALTDSITKYGTPPVCIRLLLSHHQGSYTFVEQRLDPSLCLIFINRPSQGRSPDHFRQQLATDIAHCYIPWMFPGQFEATYLARRWWNHALAEYLGNTVYPSVNLEWRLAPSMAAQENTVPMVERDAGNWMFFQFVATESGEERLAAIIQTLPGGDNPFLDEIHLAGMSGMNEQYHQFSQKMTDAAIDDTGGGLIPYSQPPRVVKAINGPGTHREELSPFQVTRWEVSVPSGQYSCITGTMSDGALVSYQEGKVGSNSGGWVELPQTETPFQNDFVVVATAAEDGQNFSLRVREVHEEPDCEDEEQEQEPPPEQCFCIPSDYFLVFQDIPTTLRELFGLDG